MSRTKLPTLAAVAGMCAIVTALTMAQSASNHSLTMKNLPQRVQQALQSYAGNEVATRIELQNTHGATHYVAVYSTPAGTKTVAVSDQGDLLAIETPLAAGQLPRAVQQLIASKYPGGTVREAESTQMLLYEVEVEVNGVVHELTTNAVGSMIGDEDEDEDEGEGDDDGDDADDEAEDNDEPGDVDQTDDDEDDDEVDDNDEDDDDDD
jgi:hypothetical protein